MGVNHRLFSFTEVRESGRPAYFFDYGEALVYSHDQIFDLREWHDLVLTGEAPVPLPSVLLDTPVGIEYGWRHADACTCSRCCERPRLHVPQPVLEPRRTQAVALRPRSGVAAAPERC